MSEDIVEVIEKGNRRAEIFYDGEAESPRRMYDNLGVMMCIHRRYRLGDEQLSEGDFESWDDVRVSLVKVFGAKVFLPLYLYEHSGITMNTIGFPCGWDSGQVGFIYAKPEESKNYSYEKIVEILKSEVEEYSNYLKGEVYAYRILNKKECPHCHALLDEYDEDDIDEELCGYGYLGLESVREAVNEELEHGN